MNIETKQVLREFLQLHLKNIENRKTPEISPAFLNYFHHSELVSIAKWMFGSVNEDVDFDAMSKQELLGEINDDYYILSYYLSKWEQDEASEIAVHPTNIMNTLIQLGHQTHYLASKAVISWDEYDHSNYRRLLSKAGKLKKVYGIYGSSISKEEAPLVCSPPKRFYEKRYLAEEAMEEMTTIGAFKAKELVIHAIDIPR